MPIAYAETIRGYLLASDQVAGNSDNKITSSVNLPTNSLGVTEFTETIGGVSVDLSKQVQFVSTESGTPITLQNIDVPSVIVKIPDRVTLSGPEDWDNIFSPPILVTTGGTVQSGFQTPTSSIQVGSPDVVLVFDKAVTLILDDTTGQTAYKLSGTNNWVLISTCTGTFANPNDPPVNGECSISDGTNTKILTYHFTEFAELEKKSSGISGGRGGGGSGGGGNPPIIKSSSLSSKESMTFAGLLKLEPFATADTNIFQVGEQIDVEFSIYEDRGFQALQHVGLYTNLRGSEREYHNSDTVILYDKGKPLDVYDPNGFWRDDISVTTKGDGGNIDIIFHITFVKPMLASDIVIYTWDFKRNGVRESFPKVWTIVESVKIESEEILETIPSTEEFKPTLHPKTYDIPMWMKSQTGAWAKGYLPETNFVATIHYLIDEQIIDDIYEYKEKDVSAKKIPHWLKNNAIWWSDELITDENFVQTIQWLLDKKIM